MKKQEDTEDYKEKYLRALADYHNLEKQTQAWREDFVKFASSGLIKKLLEILDDLEKAEEHLKDDGLSMVIKKFKDTLFAEGLTEIKLEGQEFDPNLAEVVSTEPSEKPNIVNKVLQKGYDLNGRVIRPAKVIVTTPVI